MPEFIDLSGQTFSRLTVIRRAENKGRSTAWVCRCDCGNEVVIASDHLKRGHTRSCGCLKAEGNNLRHGYSKTKAYNSWKCARYRCTSPNSPGWPDYGGRGIKMCDRWMNSFEAFLADMGERPNKLSLERVDVDGDYSPENCVWDTSKVQARNTRRKIIVEYRGESKPLAEWCELLDLSYNHMKGRLRDGWTPEEMFNTPIGQPRNANR